MTLSERVRSWFQTSPETRRRRVRRETIAMLLIGAAVVVMGHFCGPDYAPRTSSATIIWWIMFLAATLEFHVGMLVFLAALLSVRERLFGLAALCMPLLAITLGPELAWTMRSPPQTTGPTVRLMSTNVMMVNKDLEGIVGEIVAAHPDLLLVQELTDTWHAAIDRAVKGWMPHSSYVTRDDSFGIGIWSTRPFVDTPERYLRMGKWVTPQMRAVVDVHGVPVALYNIHLLPPRTVDYVEEHCRQMVALQALLEKETLTTIIGGDFNFAERTPQAGTLATLGFRDAQDIAGAGRGATWPVIGSFRYLPGIRLDHVFLRGAVACRSLTTGIGSGSDHRPLLADLSIVPPPAPSPALSPAPSPASSTAPAPSSIR